MKPTRTTALALTMLFAMAAPPGAAIAQSPHTLSLRIDNDAFDFWMLPWNRPDEEYSSGVHITYDGGSAPWWSPSFFGRGSTCTMGVQECRTARMELGQDIYTPSLSKDDPHPAPGSRANAGWLYLSQAARSLRDRRSDELTVTLGVTGPPSLARFMQSLAHSVAPEFNRPTDWSRQIAFEPGVIVRYEQRRRLFAHNGGSFGADVLPRAALSVGNVNTSGEVGLESRIGWHLPHPWLPAGGAPSVALVGGITGRAVARDIFLDGNTFSDAGELRVGHEPFVGSGELGVELRYRGISLAYRAVNSTRSYAAGPKWHPWASIVGGVTFVR